LPRTWKDFGDVTEVIDDNERFPAPRSAVEKCVWSA